MNIMDRFYIPYRPTKRTQSDSDDEDSDDKNSDNKDSDDEDSD